MNENDIENQVNLTLETGKWLDEEAGKLIAEYRACRTEHARNRLRLRLEYMKSKLTFESTLIGKLLSSDELSE